MRTFLLLAILASIFGIFFLKKSSQKPVIGVLQTASHPALDLALKGFQEEIGEEFELRVQNAEGLIPQAQLIAQQFHRDPNVKGLFTIATPATQVMVHMEKEKPIVFSAVTDPAVLGISSKQKNVTGCRDMIDVPRQIDLLITLCPEAQTVALLFSPGEVNSVSMVKCFEKELEKRGLKSVQVGIQSESEIAMATQVACQRADVILTPTDNLVASAIQQIVRISKKHQTPLIVSDNLLVEKGALAACGVNYEDSGKEAAKMLRKILKENQSPENIPIRKAAKGQVVLNKEFAK